MLRGFFVHVLDVYKRFPVIPSKVRTISYLYFKEIVCCSLHLCKALRKEKVMLHLSQFSLEIIQVSERPECLSAVQKERKQGALLPQVSHSQDLEKVVLIIIIIIIFSPSTSLLFFYLNVP